MFNLNNGILSMDDHDIDHIQGWIEEDDYSPKEALQIELEGAGIDINNVKAIQLTETQKSNKSYYNVYLKITDDLKSIKDKLLDYCYKYKSKFIADLYESDEEGQEQFDCLIMLIQDGTINSIEELKEYGMDY